MLSFMIVVNDNGELKSVTESELSGIYGNEQDLLSDQLESVLQSVLNARQGIAPAGTVTFAAEADAHTSALFSDEDAAEAYCTKMRNRELVGYRPVWRTRRYEIDQRR